ncbi:MAG: sulfatase, partial [Anaerolineales bacterium]
GMPSVHGDYTHFTIEKVMDGVISLLGELPVPFLAYIHLLPPHSPYRPNVDFHKMFNDKWAPPPTDRHPLGDGPKTDYHGKRQTYDEFIANLDNEVGRLLEYFEYSGLLENSYFILTSDHGELFEHGHRGHSTPLLFQPLLNIPLIMNTPGQNQRKDIFKRTSSIDILPTLLQVTGTGPAKTLDGVVLLLKDGDGESERNIWALEARNNSTFGPLNETTLALLSGTKKLVYYHEYKNYKNQYELYDLESDPDELENVFSTDPVSPELQSKLESKFNEIRNPLR